ncbi:hypothetical protein EPUS_00364 [Endocarpon pusillum Z07020]|uniref:Uncharacterized protein n=1 Tax=Endocarpon pusillum (strain Z07020 / HMAS-L-300199) TaxID=1263415 RepID=U1GEN5_ENDPU|nr:uncharacterized protein EPUS_00364 [Endocarpon pusillum Z07020]ERF70176.1 hypothetical protein EPUS_00364 [Endocarpon pusillum Z07020]
MAETVNPVEITPQPPSNTAPSAPTPSQPTQISRISSPTPHFSASSNLPPQQPQQSQQPLPQSPVPTMPPSVQPQSQSQPQPQPQTPNNNQSTTTAAIGSSYPPRAAPGAPGRNYLNTHLAPYLRTGMTKILDAKPQYPLRWLGEYLISQSLIHEGATDEKGVVERFIYDEHGAAVKRLRPESTIAAVGGSDQIMGDGAVGGVAVETGEAGREDTEMGGS